MAGFVEICVDGLRLKVEANLSLMVALKAQGIDIPSLCYHPKLGYQGRCSLCVIELSCAENWETKHACSLYCKPGMEIQTNSPRIHSLRARAASLLLLHGPFADLAIENKLKEMAIDPFPVPNMSTDPKSQSGCILCGRCIAICQKIGRNKLTLLGRGQRLRISYVGSTSGPKGCGRCKACKQLCPTGFISTNGESAFTAQLYG